LGRWICLLAVPVTLIATASGQSPTSDGFDVASVRPNPSRTGIRGHSFPGDRFEAKNVPLADLVLVAYGEPGQLLPPSQVVGGPSWMNTDRFDVSATLGGDRRNTVAEKQLRLRRLLADRFKLVVHTETKDLPIYALALSRKDGSLGAQLRRADVACEALDAAQPGKRDGCILSALPSGDLMLRGQTMGALANGLTILLGRTVRDSTGLMGGFDADARFSPDGLPGMSRASQPDSTREDAPPLFTALEEQLGLKLSAARGPVEILVIDRAERPSEN
jgi:uncharacterized protein (TIGR03435 family)